MTPPPLRVHVGHTETLVWTDDGPPARLLWGDSLQLEALADGGLIIGEITLAAPHPARPLTWRQRLNLFVARRFS